MASTGYGKLRRNLRLPLDFGGAEGGLRLRDSVQSRRISVRPTRVAIPDAGMPHAGASKFLCAFKFVGSRNPSLMDRVCPSTPNKADAGASSGGPTMRWGTVEVCGRPCIEDGETAGHGEAWRADQHALRRADSPRGNRRSGLLLRPLALFRVGARRRGRRGGGR